MPSSDAPAGSAVLGCAAAAPKAPQARLLPGGGRWLPPLVVAILLLHSGLVAWSAWRHSPTTDEVGELAAGLSHWQLGRFDLYRVNPPLVRMWAALPVLAARPKLDWSLWSPYRYPASRLEGYIGAQFIANNPARAFELFALARWACLPFSLLGAYVCYRWSRELFGTMAGLLALVLWCFSPNILAHAALMTTDVPATALTVAACYAFGRWLEQPYWHLALTAAAALALADLAKNTCLILLVIYPVIWCASAWSRRTALTRGGLLREAGQLATMYLVALAAINLAYGFEGSFRELGSYRFVSEALAGPSRERSPAQKLVGSNRFADSFLGRMPVPLPSNYVQGLDLQKCDLENADGSKLSYLNGEFRGRGWWYFYLYALTVKVPLGSLLLATLALVASMLGASSPIGWRAELLLCLPAVAILTLVSSQTGFTHHLRYVLPIFPFVWIWMSRLGSLALVQRPFLASVAAFGLCTSVASSLSAYPYSFCYFNALAGGPSGGPAHLLDSNADWGQDFSYLQRWLDAHPEACPLGLAYWVPFDAYQLDRRFVPAPVGPTASGADPRTCGPRPGWYAVSVNQLHGYLLGGRPDPGYTYFQELTPAVRVTYSAYVYHITLPQANRLRARLGLPGLGTGMPRPADP